MKRKILSLILVFAMTVSLLTVGTGAVEPTYGDTAGHWAESSIERWSAYGIIQGSNGLFDPNGQLTCAQLATILAKLLKLPAAKDAGFTDNTADAWYYDAINRCAAAGILNGNGDGTVTPEAPITRERAMVMLARALGIEPIRKPDLTKYTDAAQVSAYAQGYVAALIEAGIVGGVTADELAPQDNINRASTVTILDRAIGTYADKAGATVKADGKGIVLVVAENVKITGAPEGTKIVVADGATGLTVNGKSVSDDQTYIVPKTEPAKPSSSSSGGYSHSHSYADAWSHDATHHWHASTCGHNLKIDEAAHTFTYADNGNGTHTKSCFACSYSATEAHSYDESNRCVCGLIKPAENVLASVKQADGTCTYYPTLPGAVAVAADGATITLLNEQELSANLVFSTKVTLNLNGQAVETKGYAIQVQGSGDLTVTGNGTVNNDQEAVEVNNKKNYRTIFSVEGETAKLTIENGTFTTKASQAIFAEGTVTIHDGTFQNTAESVNGALDSSAMITAKGSAANMIIHKASVFATAESGNNGIYGIYGANGAHITLEDGVEVHTSFAAIGMNNTTSNPEVVITVNGGAYRSECQQLDDAKYSKFNAVCYLPGKCQMTINGGTFIAGNNKMHIFSIPYAQAGMNLTIKDGTFTAGSNVFYSKNDNHENQTTANMITVSGGSFTGAIAAFHESNTFSNFVTGGTFSSDPTAYVAEGYFSLPNENSTYTVVTADQITSGVTIQGIAGYEHRAFATAANAFEVVKSDLEARCGLVEQAMNEAQFNAFFIENGKITWTVYGEQDVTDSRTFSFGRKANRFGEGRHITEINIIGGNDTAALNLSAVNGTFALPYNWWNVEDSANTALKCKNIKFNGIKSMPSGTYQCTLHPTTYEFDGCTFNGNLYSYQNFDVVMTIKNSTFNAPDTTTQYAFMSQGTGGTITLDHNNINGYTRGVNLQRPGTDFIFTNNTITSTVSEPDRAAIQLTDGKSFVVNGNTVRVNAGNAFWFHNAATNNNVTYTISNNDIEAAYIGYSGVTSFNVNDKITSSGNIFNSTDTTRCMKKEATEATATNLTAIH